MFILHMSMSSFSVQIMSQSGSMKKLERPSIEHITQPNPNIHLLFNQALSVFLSRSMPKVNRVDSRLRSIPLFHTGRHDTQIKCKSQSWTLLSLRQNEIHQYQTYNESSQALYTVYSSNINLLNQLLVVITVQFLQFLHGGKCLGGDEDPWLECLRHRSCQPDGTPKE